MNALAAELRKIPPVTRFLCASSLATTLPVILQLVSPYKFLYVQHLVFRQWELWRLFTTFFYGSTGINYVFDLAMLYRTAAALESGPFARRPADLAWQLLLAAPAILALATPLGAFTHARPLGVCLTYLSSALAPPGATASLMGLLTLPVAALPYALLALDLLMAGPRAAAQAAAGAVVGHVWWWGVFGAGGAGGALARVARAPAWVRWAVGEGSAAGGAAGGAAAAGDFGGVHVIAPRRAGGSATATATATGYRWGAGQRLGGG